MDRETRKKTRKQKAIQFANELKQGLTLQDVGDKYGYTREYVRQILLNELGIKSNQKDYKFKDMGIKDEAIKCLVEEYNEKLQKLKAEKNKLYTEFANMRNYYHKKYGARYRTLKGEE